MVQQFRFDSINKSYKSFGSKVNPCSDRIGLIYVLFGNLSNFRDRSTKRYIGIEFK